MRWYLYRTAVSTGWRPNQLPHHDRVLAAGHELTDDGRAWNLTGDQQPTGCLGIGEQECLVFIDGRQVDMWCHPVEVCDAYRR